MKLERSIILESEYDTNLSRNSFFSHASEKQETLLPPLFKFSLYLFSRKKFKTKLFKLDQSSKRIFRLQSQSVKIEKDDSLMN